MRYYHYRSLSEIPDNITKNQKYCMYLCSRFISTSAFSVGRNEDEFFFKVCFILSKLQQSVFFVFFLLTYSSLYILHCLIIWVFKCKLIQNHHTDYTYTCTLVYIVILFFFAAINTFVDTSSYIKNYKYNYISYNIYQIFLITDKHIARRPL